VNVVGIFHSTIAENENPQYIYVNIINDGQFTAVIPFSFFIWHFPFGEEVAQVMPMDYYGVDQFVPKKHYPYEIVPRSSRDFYISNINIFRESMTEFFGKKENYIVYFIGYCEQKYVVQMGSNLT
jgi:hypothetical protein